MLNKLFKAFSGKDKSEPAVDLSLGYARLDEFRTWLSDGNYGRFESTYEQLNWDAKTLLNEGIGLDQSCSEPIEQWVKQRPDSYIARLFAGVSCTNLAWIARTAARGTDVSQERTEKFFDWLEQAAEHLRIADELNSSDAEVCARMIRVYMGLGVEKETVQSFFDAAIEAEPNHLMAHLMMINHLNPKWGGSIEEMYEFANKRYAESNNSLLITLPLFAIAEEWLYYGMVDDKKKERKTFFNDQERKVRVNHMYTNYTETEEGRLLVPYVYNYFGFLLYQFGEKHLAKQAIAKINGRMTVYPWAYIGIENPKQLESLV